MEDRELLGRLSADRALASVVLFGHRHPQREAPMHVEFMDLAVSADELVEIEAFREAGKTLILGRDETAAAADEAGIAVEGL